MSAQPEWDDNMPGLIAALDQLKAGLPMMAEASRAIYDAYRAAGFTERQAFEIVLEHLHVLFESATKDDDDE